MQDRTRFTSKHQRTGRLRALAVALAAATVLLAGCTAPASRGEVLQQAGSSTVLPIAEAWAEALAADGQQVVVQGGGSGAGASKICAGEIDVGDMSREIKDSEIETCRANGIEPLVWKVAYDGLTVVVNNDNDWVDHLTVEELRHIWRPDDPAQTWAEVRPNADPAWPDERIVLFGPDSDSGTYEYFNEVVLGDDTAPRADHTPSSDDNVLVEGVAQTEFGIGHFGFAYYLINQDRLRAVPIADEGAGEPVAPTFETIADGSYSPLSRPLFMVTNGRPEAGTPLHAYFEYAMGPGQDLVRDVGYVALDPATIEEQTGWL